MCIHPAKRSIGDCWLNREVERLARAGDSSRAPDHVGHRGEGWGCSLDAEEGLEFGGKVVSAHLQLHQQVGRLAFGGGDQGAGGEREEVVGLELVLGTDAHFDGGSVGRGDGDAEVEEDQGESGALILFENHTPAAGDCAGALVDLEVGKCEVFADELECLGDAGGSYRHPERVGGANRVGGGNEKPIGAGRTQDA